MNEAGVNVYEVSRLLYDLKDSSNRESYRANPEKFYRRYAVGEKGLILLLRRDWSALVEAGVSIYLLTKLAAVTDTDLLAIGASMRGIKRDEFMSFIKQQNERNRRYAMLVE